MLHVGDRGVSSRRGKQNVGGKEDDAKGGFLHLG